MINQQRVDNSVLIENIVNKQLELSSPNYYEPQPNYPINTDDPDYGPRSDEVEAEIERLRG